MSTINEKLYEGPKELAMFTPGVIIHYKMIDPAYPLSESGAPMDCQMVDWDRAEGDMIVFTGLAWFGTAFEKLVRISHNWHTGEAEIVEYL